MPKKRIFFLAAFAIVLLFAIGIAASRGRVEKMEYGFDREVRQAEKQLRLEIVKTAQVWLDTTEDSDAHRTILDIYNTHEPLAQGYTVKEDDNWCATFVSAVAIECGRTDIIPTECGCQRQIGLWQELGRWEEDDSYIPLPGDIIYYCTGDKNPTSDCTGWSDHVGIVVGTCGGYMKIIEGNFNNAVGYRYIKLDSTGIRGFGLPDYGLLEEE